MRIVIPDTIVILSEAKDPCNLQAAPQCRQIT
jgi:hypothetical protein